MKKKINDKMYLKDVVIDEELYPRVNYSWQTAYDYSQSMKSGAKFPRIVVAKFNNMRILIDGRHRLEAYKSLLGMNKFNKFETQVEVLVGLSKNQIFEESVSRNITHGRQFSVQEKLKIAITLKDLKYSTSKISQLVQIPTGKLTTLISKRLINSISGDDILKPSFQHLVENNNIEDISYIQKSFTGSSQLSIINELISLIKSKTINKKDKEVKKALKELKKIL